jgi:pectinacetylesterase
MRLAKAILLAGILCLTVCTNPEIVPKVTLAAEWQTELTWTWVANEQMISRTGLTSGYGINLNPSSDKLLIYLEAGGACYNEQTCVDNPTKFDEGDFENLFINPGYGNYMNLFNRQNANNPFTEWNLLYVPYTTGDLHAGNKQAVDIPFGGPDNQQMVGYNNISVLLAEAAPILLQKGIKEVFLCGTSAGSIGSVYNYDQIARAFPGINISMLADGAELLFSDNIFPVCLSTLIDSTWDVQLAEDYNQFVNGTYSHKMLGIYEYLSNKYPYAQFGIYSSYYDWVIRWYYGFGRNNCAHEINPTEAQVFKDGLLDLAEKLNDFDNWKVYYEDSDAHTILWSSRFNTLSISNTKFSDWVAQLNAKSAANVME